MTKTELMNAKGTRDFAPEEKILRDKIEKTIISVFETYGFPPLETPVLERFELLSSKYAGGAEILKETFRLYDQGKRELGLRYDLTVPFCRFIGMNPAIKIPFKRYQTGTVYRDGPVSSDRLRVFTQCDADVVGTKSMTADAECIMIAETVFKKLKIKARLEVNNRKFLDGLLEDIGVPQKKWIDAILIIDKIKKAGQNKAEEELEKLGLSKQQVKQLFLLFKEAKGTNEQMIKVFKKKLKSKIALKGLRELEELFAAIPDADKKNVLFMPTLARGLAYYTGTVYEAVALEEAITSSLAAGGRYDKIIQQFLGSAQEYPAVGISFGLDRLSIILEQRKKEKQKTITEVFVIPVIPVNAEKLIAVLLNKLRDAGIKTETDLMKRGISKNLQYANSLGIPFVLFVGEEEVKIKKYKLKEMKTGKETMLSIDECIRILKNQTINEDFQNSL